VGQADKLIEEEMRHLSNYLRAKFDAH